MSVSASTQALLLGTGAGPTPKIGRHPTAAAVLSRGATYVIDCGNGVGLQLARSGVPLTSLRAIFITHHHLDHVADFGTLITQAWSELRAPLKLIGPPPLERMLQLYQEMFSVDLSSRVAEEGRAPFDSLVEVEEITSDGVCYTDDRVTVSCQAVRHGSLTHAYAYRFDCKDRVIVFSGDTAYCDELIDFTRGAHTLVHEAVYLPALSSRHIPSASERLLERIKHAHSSVEDAARVAHAAGVEKLVLSPLAPAQGVPDEQWLAAAMRHFAGEIVVGRDLLSV